MGTFRLHAVYHVLSGLSFLSHLYEYLLRYPWIFFILFFRRLDPVFLFFLIVREVASVAFSGNNASLHFGVGVLFHSDLNLCYQLRWWTQQSIHCVRAIWMQLFISKTTERVLPQLLQHVITNPRDWSLRRGRNGRRQ